MEKRSITYTATNGDSVKCSDWFFAKVTSKFPQNNFGIGEVVLVSMVERLCVDTKILFTVRVMNSGMVGAIIQLESAKKCLRSVREADGSVVWCDDQENCEESWQVASGLID